MSIPVDWKPERAIQAKIRDMQKKIYSWWIENPKGRFKQKLGISRKKREKKRERMKYTQKKSNDYLKVEFERYLGPVQKGRLFDKLRSIGLYPDSVLVKGLYPDDVCIFSSDIIPIQSYQVFVLWCRATFGPAHVCLNSLTVLLLVEFHTYAFMRI